MRPKLNLVVYQIGDFYFMKTLLIAINAKYIHSNLAVFSLKSYASCYEESVEVLEYTINQKPDEILADIYMQKPDVLCFSCYIWNIVFVRQLVVEIKKVLPHVKVWLGGPEVSYDAEDVLRRYPEVDGIMCGEGEATFLELLDFLHGKLSSLESVKGIVFRCDDSTCGQNRLHRTSPRPVLDLTVIPFVYKDMGKFQNKIIYYESSRGCPFSCSYCLSSVDKCLRFRDVELVKKELQIFIDAEIPQVKFVDRTFNCNHAHAVDIWSFILQQDKGKTNFHFEVAADLLNELELNLIGAMRPGLIQLEIGIQSTNKRTIREIQRVMDFERVKAAVVQIREKENIHQHLDLIAGLPYEDYESFRQSFCDVYALSPNQLQLGFLKVLKGSFLHEKVEDYQLKYQNMPPFEVLSTKWISFAEIITLKGIEEMVEIYYNSGQFQETLPLLAEAFSDPFTMFESLSNYYKENGLHMVSHSRISRYEILFQFAMQKNPAEEMEYRKRLIVDIYLRENVKNRPGFLGEAVLTKEEAQQFYEIEAQEHKYLTGYEQYDKRQLRKMTHLEKIDDALILFDYKNRNLLTNQAKIFYIKKGTD